MFGHPASDAVLRPLFDRHRGRCYEDKLTFAELVAVLAGPGSDLLDAGNVAGAAGGPTFNSFERTAPPAPVPRPIRDQVGRT